MAKLRFKLVGGRHQAGVGDDKKIFNKGDIIETERELDKIFGVKFQRLEAGVAVSPDPPTPAPEVSATSPDDDPYHLLDMTKSELIEFAGFEEIEIPATAKSKAQILKAIQQALEEA